MRCQPAMDLQRHAHGSLGRLVVIGELDGAHVLEHIVVCRRKVLGFEFRLDFCRGTGHLIPEEARVFRKIFQLLVQLKLPDLDVFDLQLVPHGDLQRRPPPSLQRLVVLEMQDVAVQPGEPENCPVQHLQLPCLWRPLRTARANRRLELGDGLRACVLEVLVVRPLDASEHRNHVTVLEDLCFHYIVSDSMHMTPAPTCREEINAHQDANPTHLNGTRQL